MKNFNFLMYQAVSEGVFPGAVLLVSKEDKVVFFKAFGYANLFTKNAVTRDTVFDLASLTKPLATTLAVMVLIQQGKLSLEQQIGSILPSFHKTEKEKITIKHLLCHMSGLPDFRPYYVKLSQLPIGDRRPALRELLLKEPLLSAIGEKVLYSDLGFMILNWVIETVSGKRLDYFVYETIYHSLGLEHLFFVDLTATPRTGDFAATERCPWRHILLEGRVHDDNAYAAGGVEGHAGLFGIAADVHRLLLELLSTFHGYPLVGVVEKALLKTFFARQENSDRALGFDLPSTIDASCGNYFSRSSVGHLGFTGTSFWMDLEKSVIIILLTNRVHPTRDNDKIKGFRPKLHDAVMRSINNEI
jgi:CubicO group peptidase (beta-lactamase class C family)